MKCQNCKKNEADKTFVINMMGNQYEAHVCSDCLQQMWQYAQVSGQGAAFKAFSGWWPGKENPRQTGSPFPEDAGEFMKKRIRLSSLRARLEDAAKNERYEEAAGLRDQLARETAGEKETTAHES